MDNTFFQLLQEVSTLGRDPKYIGFKMGAKPDSTEVDSNSVLGHASGRVAPVTEEPMSDEEDDDEDRFSFTSTTSTAKVLAENDKNKDNSKYDRLSWSYFALSYFIARLASFPQKCEQRKQQVLLDLFSYQLLNRPWMHFYKILFFLFFSEGMLKRRNGPLFHSWTTSLMWCVQIYKLLHVYCI